MLRNLIPLCFSFSSTNFLAAATDLSSSGATGRHKVAYSMLTLCQLTFFLSRKICLTTSSKITISNDYNKTFAAVLPINFTLKGMPKSSLTSKVNHQKIRTADRVHKTKSVIYVLLVKKGLDHFPRSDMDFFFTFSIFLGSLHSFPSIGKTPSIIPIQKIGRLLDSRVSFRHVSFTFCVSKLFERIIQSRLLFFLKSSSILSPRHAGFRPGPSTVDLILFFSQSISDRFNKPKPVILASTDVS